MLSSPAADDASRLRRSERPYCTDAAHAKRKTSWFYRRSRTSPPITSDPTLFLPSSPLCKCWTLTSHVDPRWFMISERELLTQTMCMSVWESCQASIVSSLCRPVTILWDFFGSLPINKQLVFCSERHLASLSWVFNPLERKNKYLCFWLCSVNERVLKWLTLGAMDSGTFFLNVNIRRHT